MNDNDHDDEQADTAPITHEEINEVIVLAREQMRGIEGACRSMAVDMQMLRCDPSSTPEQKVALMFLEQHAAVIAGLTHAAHDPPSTDYVQQVRAHFEAEMLKTVDPSKGTPNTAAN